MCVRVYVGVRSARVAIGRRRVRECDTRCTRAYETGRNLVGSGLPVRVGGEG
jgi:hypothetical protein